MKPSVALFLSAASAASIPSDMQSRAAGIALSEFGQFQSITAEEVEAKADVIGNGFTPVEKRAEQGLPLATFGKVHSITVAQAEARVDLIGTDFSSLPVSKVDVDVEIDIDVDISVGLHQRAAGDCANPRIRFEWDNYSTSDKKAFVDGIQCLVNRPPSGKYPEAKNRYEDLVRLHQKLAPNIHSKSTQQQTHKFLLWHRYYVWAFEQIMRDECGFTRAFPWWDEKKWAGKFSQSTLFTDQYFGRLQGATNGAGTCVNTGRFAGMQVSLGPGFATNNPHCVQRAVDESVTAQTGANSWNACMQRATYPEFHSCVEFSFHAQGHNGVGATMADAIASPGDPTFFMHHLYVDYALRKWQNNAASRKTSISGCADNVNCAPLTLDTMVYVENICGAKCPDLKVRDLLNTLQGHMCYRYDY